MHFGRDGLAIWCKRLEQGRFQWPQVTPGQARSAPPGPSTAQVRETSAPRFTARARADAEFETSPLAG